jgi:hypothetical protein
VSDFQQKRFFFTLVENKNLKRSALPLSPSEATERTPSVRLML